jgi:secreted trypsin-like serine protease
MHRRRTVRTFLGLLVVVIAAAAIAGVGTREGGDSSGDVSARGLDADAQGASGRIVGGSSIFDEAAWTARWPFLVAILDARVTTGQKQAMACSGSLVTPTLVLTTASCATRVPAASMRVLAGSSYLEETDSGLFRVGSVATHPSWTGVPTTGPDLALLTLTTRSTSGTVSVVGPNEDAIWGAGAGVETAADRGPTVAGWGAWGAGANEYFPYFASQADVPIWPDTACTGTTIGWGTQFNATNLLCAGKLAPADATWASGASICTGDSGAPLVAAANGTWRLVGVAGFTIEGCTTKRPDGYAKLASARTWLASRGVPIGTGTVAGTLPAPVVPGGGSVTQGGTTPSTSGGGAAATPAPAGAPITLTAPSDGLVIEQLAGKTQLTWSLRSDMRLERLRITNGAKTVLDEAGRPDAVGFELGNAAMGAGTYRWCVVAVPTAGGAATESCRSFVRRSAHLATVTRARWRGRDARVNGEVASNAPSVRVVVALYAGGTVVSRSKPMTVRMTRGKVAKFAYRDQLRSRPRTASLRAVITVTGGGVTSTFRNTLR